MAELKRAYSTFSIKAVEGADGKRRFTGIASTPSVDRMGDVIEPEGMEITIPTPLLWQHSSDQPIGWVRSAKVSKKGIEVECEVANITEAGALKDRIDSCWTMLKTGLVGGLSVGFNVLESARIEGTYGYRYLRTALLELSTVTIPCNQDCSINTIKSIDQQMLRAASGKSRVLPVDRLKPPPGASGTKSQPASSGFFYAQSKGNIMKTIQELREERATKAARLQELVGLFKTAGHESTDEEGAEFDQLTAEVKALDTDIRVKQFEATQAAAAAPARGQNSEEAIESRKGMSFVKKADPDDKFKGQSFTRLAIAKAISFIEMKNGNFVTPADVAQHRWGNTHKNLVALIKTAVAGGGTGSGEWGAELAQSDTRFTGDFIEFLYSMTVFDKLPLRSVPARVHIKGQDGAATGYWVGESKAIPVSKADFSDVELTPLKVGAIAACSKELVLDSSPSAELFIRDSIAQASAQRVDTTFLSATAASAGVSPAGILNGLSLYSPSGTDADAVRADLMTLYSTFLTAKNASGLVQVMTPSLAKALQMLRNSLGQREFPDIRADGGTLEGDPVYTGDNVTPGSWILLKPSDIWKIGDGGIELSMSDSATIEQNDAPQGAGDTPTAASATLMSLWQTEQVGFKLTRRINYAKRRSTAVAAVQDAEYGGVVS